MFCDLGTLDQLVTTALVNHGLLTMIYVPRGQPQPGAAENPDGLPWFRHKIKKTSIPKRIASGEPDKAKVLVSIVVFAPAELVETSTYAFSSALSAIANVLAFTRLTDGTHTIVFDEADEEQDWALGGEAGPSEGLQVGSVNVTGLASRV